MEPKSDSIRDENYLKCENLEKSEKNEPFVPSIRWPDLLAQIFIHAGSLYGIYLCLVSAKYSTLLFALLTIWFSGFGITAGAHRLWSHKSYKAKWPLKLILTVLFTVSGQRDIYMWALDHRVHHKYGESDSDPHNVKRGFFFSHVGWLFLTPHPEVVQKRKIIDMSDLLEDPFVVWQKRLYPLLFFVFVLLIPIGVPVYFWNESLWTSFWVNFNARFCLTLNMAFLVNSVAHMWGQKPYDKNISPVENIGVSILALGEGWHNYHHVFPWDYRTGELGNAFNPTTKILDFFAKIGWAYDLKSVSGEMIARRAKKTGDGSHAQNLWGYGDKDMSKEDLTELENSKKAS